MGDLSEHFSRHEFECYCGCGFDTVDIELVEVLEAIHDNFGNHCTVNVTKKGGCRCEHANHAAGGSRDSQHKKGRAADIWVEGMPASLVQRFLLTHYGGRYGIGCYETFTHIDTRTNGPARWNG